MIEITSHRSCSAAVLGGSMRILLILLQLLYQVKIVSMK